MTGLVVYPNELDSLIEAATSSSIPNGDVDLHASLEISDIIRSKRIPHKDSMRCLKKRIIGTYSNPNTQLASWKLTDICIKNGGTGFIKEICSREFMDTMESTILKSELDAEVKDLVTKLVYELYLAFKNDSQLNYVSKVHDKLKARGIQFPDNLMDSRSALNLFDSKTPADWIDSDACMICSRKFSLLNRRHHCRSCGGIFCQDHSSNNIQLPDLGIHDLVRVCDNCYDDYDIKNSGGSSKPRIHHHKSDKNKEYFDAEEEQLRKAIKLSLKENHQSNQYNNKTEPIVPYVNHEDAPKDTINTEEIDNDPELKAAIEASLKQSEIDKDKRLQLEQYSQQQQEQQQGTYYRNPNINQASIQQSAPYNSYEISSEEENNIYLFASLVEKLKNKPTTEVLEDQQLQALYQKVVQSRPRLNNSLNDTVTKYNTLIEMNGKISNIMNIYDELLENQLNSINVRQTYAAPVVPSDPYTYYQQQSAQPHQSNTHLQQHQVANEIVQPTQVKEESTLKALGNLVIDNQKPNNAIISPYPIEESEPEPVVTHLKVATEPPYSDNELKIGSSTEFAPIDGSADSPLAETSNKQTDNITAFDFPTVPAVKTALVTQEPQIVQEEPQEELLLEL
ncbi:hypothetical protein TPHA_0H02110 [Tetrapisispora phaffii CBS 4417]|uniref:Vacuolar protein sorting-associated protein 27 n=1 Tax=Tetrapisispora phaffii (strain ATCC 24235 / CBS 4417 / NBRC 1672 / NRRL Y-8282 / UCD 70-5) TaxID=1071381 RepID=G8BWG4_TETPH|nr:hypothetical protein TPHA_0H02110 [Tetrapisispora phaffii CBS 4417]CCE64415.1 hypothetical protein TPHA_0H02110 [Tetrapisispora phaffii CBS 4417]